MIWELARIRVKAGAEQAFERAVTEARRIFQSAPGCHGLRLQRSIEEPSRYVLVVGWDTVEAHTVDFRASNGFQEWRALAGPHFAEPPMVEHVSTIIDAGG